MTGRNDATPDSGAIGARLSADLMADLSRLRERIAAARRRSLAISAAAVELCAVSQARCDEAKRRREQWQTWRRGTAALQVRPAPGARRPTLRFCPRCEMVCFAEAQVDAPPRPDQPAAEPWVEPPDYVKGSLARGWLGLAVNAAPCPRCAAADLPAAPAPPPSGPLPRETAMALLGVLDEINAAAEELAGLDADDAFDRAFSRAIERLSASLSTAELGELADALHALMRQLLGRGAARRSTPTWRTRAHFRPRLRQP